MDFDGSSIVCPEKGQHEEAFRLRIKVRRDITNAQPAIGIAIIAMKRNETFERIGLGGAPSRMLGGEHFSGVMRMKVQPIEQIATCDRIVRVELDGLSICADR